MESSLILQLIKEQEEEFESISDRIWEFAEIRYQERQSAGLLCQALAGHGFQVTRPLAGMETAFMGEYGSGKPVIAFLGEFDALPQMSQKADGTVQEPVTDGGNGHGCGHHLLGTGSLEAACAVKRLIEQGILKGTVRYYGCPAEEGGAGKGYMVRAGVFEDVDLCLTWHPAETNYIMNSSLANLRMFFKYYGLSAHAGMDPHLGRSALDALELTNVGCNYLREHIIPEARLHYAVTDTGGTAPNIVQSYAEEIYCVRAPRQDQLEEIFERVCNVARGAALMTDTRLEIKVVSAYANLIPNRTMSRLAIEKFKDFCPLDYTDEELNYAARYRSGSGEMPVNTRVAEEEVPFGGSTDVGDVSWVCPTLSIAAATFAAGTANHSWKAVAQGKSSVAKKGMHLAACTLAAVAAELYEKPELREAAVQDFKKELGCLVYHSLIPESAKPGDF